MRARRTSLHQGLVRHRLESRPGRREQGLRVGVRVVVHRRQHGLARRCDAQRCVTQETLDLLGVLHDTDPSTKNGSDQVQKSCPAKARNYLSGVQGELELGDHAEVPTAPGQCPQQVGAIGRTCPDHSPSR